MDTKDYLSILSLLVSASAFALAFTSARKAGAAKTKADLLEIVSRKNEIVGQYLEVLNLISECRFYAENLSRVLDQTEDGSEEHSEMQGLIRENLTMYDAEVESTKRSIDKVKAFDPNEIATSSRARLLLEELNGRPSQIKIRLTGSIEYLKRAQPILDRAAALGKPTKGPG